MPAEVAEAPSEVNAEALNRFLFNEDTVDKVLESIQKGLDAFSSVLDLPIIGDQLKDATQFVADLRGNVVDAIKTALANAVDVYGGLDNALRMSLFDMLTTDTNGDYVIQAGELSGNVFLNFLRDSLRHSPVPTHTLCFEITETSAIANLATAAHVISELRALGCHFALDDFGTGMSSFAYLKHLPVDYLKIDGSFVKDMARDPVNRAMVDMIQRISVMMGKRTIAEYVEDADTLELLRTGGVHYAQGFGIARIVFTYLDYLLLDEATKKDFKFQFRTSIEHFYPQHPDKQQSGAEATDKKLHLLGNLALVSVGANSKFSNSFPKAKAENFKDTIAQQSPKLRQMADIALRDGWGDAQVQAHHNAMLTTLQNALGPHLNMRD